MMKEGITKHTADSPTLELSMLLACIKLLDRAQHIFTPRMLKF